MSLALFKDTQASEPHTKTLNRFERWNGAKFEYLHKCKLDAVTTNPKDAWIGSATQAVNVRRKFPHAKTFQLVRMKPTDNIVRR